MMKETMTLEEWIVETKERIDDFCNFWMLPKDKLVIDYIPKSMLRDEWNDQFKKFCAEDEIVVEYGDGIFRYITKNLMQLKTFEGTTLGVSIRRNGHDKCHRDCTVEEFLSKDENKSGTWYIDGGWGGPPGEMEIEWNETHTCWANKGYTMYLYRERYWKEIV